MEKGTVEVARRDTLTKEFVEQDKVVDYVVNLLDTIQNSIFEKALNFRHDKTTKADSFEEFKQILDEKGGFVSAHWDGSPETEEKIKELTKATIRCIPLDAEKEEGKCILTGKPSAQRVLFARAY